MDFVTLLVGGVLLFFYVGIGYNWSKELIFRLLPFNIPL